MRGDPLRARGKVGKPSTPVSLNPEGALAFGLRIGRRAADMILMNMIGEVLAARTLTYDYPLPDAVDRFAEESIASITEILEPRLQDRIVGIGVATPFGIWKLPEEAGAPREELTAWQTHSFTTSFAEFTDLTVFTANDASMACSGELVFGNAADLTDFIYFYIGAFVGGGLVLDGRIFLGRHGNAAAFGSVLIDNISTKPNQLVQGASIYVLERALSERKGKQVKLRDTSDAWKLSDPLVDAWVSQTGRSLAVAAISVSATVDVDCVVVDGNFPRAIKEAVRARMSEAFTQLDTSEILQPSITTGMLGRKAAAIGAAYQPIMAAHFIEGSQIHAGV
eukprot:g17301.t1